MLDLVVDDESDDLSPEERERLHRAIDRGIADAADGRVESAEMVVERLRQRD